MGQTVRNVIIRDITNLHSAGVVVACSRWLHDHPDEGEHDLHGDQRARNDHLRLGTYVARPLGALRRRVENAGYPVGFGDQGAVDYGEADADAETLADARRGGGLHQQGERVEVAQENAEQEHVAQLATCTKQKDINKSVTRPTIIMIHMYCGLQYARRITRCHKSY